MKTLHIIASVDPASGGPIEGILRQHEALGPSGSREIVSLDSPAAPFLNNLPLTVYPLGPPRHRERGQSRVARFAFSPRLLPWLRENAPRYDSIIVNGLWNYASVAASIVLPSSRTPYFVFSHGMLDPWFRTTYPIKHIQKQISWLLFEGRLARHAQAVLFTTSEEERLARGQFWGHEYKPKVVGYGTSAAPARTPEQDHAFRRIIPGLGDKPYLLYLSRIHPKKGCDLLIEAFGRCNGRLSNMHLVVAGPDTENLVPELAARAHELGIGDRVHWPGMLRGDAKWGALYGATAFILPSHQENFGIAVAEALACGTPVLITDKVNIWREIDGGGAGLIAEDNQAGVTSLLDRFATLTPQVRHQMGIRARETFAAHFDISNTSRVLRDFMQERLVAR